MQIAIDEVKQLIDFEVLTRQFAQAEIVGIEQPIITIVCPFGDGEQVEAWLTELAGWTHDRAKTHLVLTLDCDHAEALKELRGMDKLGYRSVKIQWNEGHVPNMHKLHMRRNRIAFLKEQSKEFVANTDCEYVIGLEADTKFAGLNWQRLITPFMGNDRVGFVQGVQVGRHRNKHIGAWRADNIYDPHEVKSVLPPNPPTGYQEIDGGGWYYYATTKTLYLDHHYYWDESFWGPDVRFGLWVKQQDKQCWIDWDSVTGHMSQLEGVLYPDGIITEATFYLNEQSEWRIRFRDTMSAYGHQEE